MASTRRRSDHPIAIIGIILLLAGGGLLAFGVSKVQEMREFLADAHSAEAIVLHMEAVYSTNGPRTNRLVVRYTDSDGISHEARTAISASSYEFSIGERVSVLYNHAVTEDIHLDNPVSLWLLPGAFAGIGGLFALVGAFLAIVGIRVGAEPNS